MRGKVGKSTDILLDIGITPAYAGKRIGSPNSLTPMKDHPRVCGEKSAPAGPCGPRIGSPPRMRGKVRVGIYTIDPPGITPAYAGKRAANSCNSGCV